MPQDITIGPATGGGEQNQCDNPWQGPFLDALAETSNVTQAAARAVISPSRAYQLRRTNAAFRSEWQAALVEGYSHLELETLHRLRMGVEAGKDDRKFDIANALRLLTLHSRSVAQARAEDCDEDEEAILARINAKIDAMRARESEWDALTAEDDDVA